MGELWHGYGDGYGCDYSIAIAMVVVIVVAMAIAMFGVIPQTSVARRGSYLVCIELPLCTRIAGRQGTSARVPKPRYLSPGT